MGSEVSTGARRTGRGRIERRQAILDAAFTVFARRGYANTCVQEIAQEAGVAKPTVYNHLHDKESLFREAVEAAADRIAAQSLTVLDQLRVATPDADPRPALTAAARGLLSALTCEEAASVGQLAASQPDRFQDLTASVRERTALRVRSALADRLARLALSGQLRTCDPDQAAEHLLSLLTGPLDYRPDADPGPLVSTAVDVFLRAYGP
ncbi:TetR/AcrR family transcriptional regulator [Kitasatospora sp. NPDC101235]|uniref:TetR/AcrR family transcriptional regulator n=1 Tax=Kitasatospora sp. NPDC101235 TaxID=3364101 RepID=UPI00380BFFC0